MGGGRTPRLPTRAPAPSSPAPSARTAVGAPANLPSLRPPPTLTPRFLPASSAQQCSVLSAAQHAAPSSRAESRTFSAAVGRNRVDSLWESRCRCPRPRRREGVTRPDSHGSARHDPGRPLPRAPHPGAPVSAPRSSLSSCEDPLLPPGERELRLPPQKPARKPSPLDASLSGFPRPLASAGCPGC